MKKTLLAATALAALAMPAFAERYVMITHTQGTDPFWPVVEKGGKDAAAAVLHTVGRPTQPGIDKSSRRISTGQGSSILWIKPMRSCIFFNRKNLRSGRPISLP